MPGLQNKPLLIPKSDEDIAKEKKEADEKEKKAEARRRLSQAADTARNQRNRVSSNFLTTLKNGVQKILTNEKNIRFFPTEEELTEYDYNQAIADIQSEFSDVAGLEEQVRDIAFMSDTDMDRRYR